MGSSEEPSLQIIGKLTAILLLFYTAYYGVSSLLSAALGVDIDGTMPFDFENFDPAADDGDKLLGWLSCVIVYLMAIVIIFCVVRSSRRTWDYVWSLSCLHWVISMIVMGGFPTNWIWWVTVLVLTLLLGALGSMANQWRESRKPSPIGPV